MWWMQKKKKKKISRKQFIELIHSIKFKIDRWLKFFELKVNKIKEILLLVVFFFFWFSQIQVIDLI